MQPKRADCSVPQRSNSASHSPPQRQRGPRVSGHARFLCQLLLVNLLCPVSHAETDTESASESAPPLAELSVAQAGQAMATGQLSSTQLTQYYLQRIHSLDQNGPELHAILELNPDALEQARQLDRERQSGRIRSPLHGMPLLIKGNIASADHMGTSAGSLALAKYQAPMDAAVLQQLRAAGLVILGKTNLSEWSNFRSSRSSSGWSSQGGQTRNPYVLNRSACGSSSGSAVAVSADLSLFALGTETNGSISCPAAMNGVVGIKPTWGAVDGQGVIPIARKQDTVGPLARSVADASALLELMLSAEGQRQLSLPLLNEAGMDLRGARIGWVSHYNAGRPALAGMMQEVVSKARAAGAEMIEIPSWTLKDSFYDDAYFVLLYEFKQDFNGWLKEMQRAGGKYPGGLANLDELIAYNRAHRDTVMPIFAQEYLEAAAALDSTREQSNARRARQRIQAASRQLIDHTLREHQLAAILLPTTGTPWLIDHVAGDRYDFGSSSAAAVAGYPAVTIPGGWQGELPLGVTLVASAWQEPRLLQLAAALEQQLAARRPPRFIPSLEALHSEPAATP